MKDLTQGSVTKHILNLSGFLALSMLFQTLYYLVDLYFVSRIGKEATAGVGFAGNLMMVVLALTQMLAVGTSTLISHAAGRKDQPRAQFVFNQSFILSLLVGAAVVVLGYLFRWPYANAISADAQTASDGAAYLLWFLPALALQFALVSMGAALRGSGVVKPTMVIQAVTVLANIVLAPVLIGGWGTHHPLGVSGAGLATLIAVSAGVLMLCYYFIRYEAFVSFDRSQWRPRMGVWREIVNIGLPAGGEFALLGFYTAFVYWVIRDFGPAAQAAFGIGARVMQSIMLPVMAVSMAASPVAGQNFGACLAPRVRQTFYSAAGLVVLLMGGLTIFCQTEAEALMRFFSNDAQVIAYGVEYVGLVSWNFVAAGLILTSSALFQAMGNAWPPLGSSSARLVTFTLSGVILSRLPGFTLRQIWYLSVATVAIQALTNLLLLRREFGRKLNFAALSAPAEAVTLAE